MNKTLSSILKATLATLLFVVGNELIGSWVLLVDLFEFENYYILFPVMQGALQLSAVLVFFFLIGNRTLKSLIKETQYRWYPFAALLGILFVFLQMPLNWFYNLITGSDYFSSYRFEGFSNIDIRKHSASIVFLPIAEELFFRRYIQHNLQKSANQEAALFVASLLFALIHSPYALLFTEYSNSDWHSVYITFFGGLATGILYIKSKSVGPPILFHIFWNLTAYSL